MPQRPASPDPQLELLRRARDIFLDVVELEEPERSRQIEAACGGELDVLALVRELIGTDQEAETGVELGGVEGGLGMLVGELLGVDVLPERIGRFRVLRELGRGGMGVVYEAQQDLPERRVALKTLRPWLQGASGEGLFRGEIQSLARVLHPGIPQIYEVFEVEGVPVMAMELVDGPTLREAVAELGLRERVAMLRDIADAVEHAHQRGVVHRDLKPANVRVNAAGQPKVLDFGIAALVGEHAQRAGTLAYMPPEQLDAGVADARADVYSLGALGWELCEGSLPVAITSRGSTSTEVSAAELAALAEEKRRARPVARALPRALAAVFSKAMAGEPEHRYRSAGLFAAELQRFLDHRPVDVLAGSPAHVLEMHSRRLWRPALLVALASLLAVAGTVQLLRLRSEARRTAMEQAASTELLALQEAAALRPAGDPDTAEAVKAFVSDPRHLGTRALSEAWLWWGQGGSPSARRALSGAWLTAPDPPSERAALLALAGVLADEERFEALRLVLGLVPEGDLPELRLQAALAARDGAAAQAFASPELSGLVGLFGEAVADPVLRPDGRMFLGGGRLVYAEEGWLWVPRPGAEAEPTGLPAELAILPVQPGEGVWGLRQEGDATRVFRVRGLPDTPRDITLEEVDLIVGRPRGHVQGDLDGDGVTERYMLTYKPTRLYRAEPPEARSRVVEGGAKPGAIPSGLSVWGEPLGLLVSSGGWRDQDLRLLGVSDIGPAEELARVRVLGKHMVQIAAADGSGPRLFLSGRSVTRRDPTRGGVQAPLELTPVGTRFEPVDTGVRIHDAGGELLAADLDADGIEDLIVAGAALVDGAVLARQLSDARLLPLKLPLLAVVEVGETDGTPGAELWMTDGHRSWIVGHEGAAPMAPDRELRAPAPQEAPAWLEGWPRVLWQRAEALVSVGLEADAALVLETLGPRPAPTGPAALVRAVELLGDRPDEAARISRVLVRREAEAPGILSAEQQRLVQEALLRSHDFSGAAALDPLGLPPGAEELTAPVEVLGSQGWSPAWRLADPAQVSLAEQGAGVRLDLQADRGPALSLPLHAGGAGFDVHAAVDLREHDWASRYSLELEVGEHAVELSISRGGGGAPEHHNLTLHCRAAEVRSPSARIQPRTGVFLLRFSYLAATGELRCETEGQVVLVERPGLIPAEGAPAVLRVAAGGNEAHPRGHVHLTLERLALAGLSPVEVDGLGLDSVGRAGELGGLGGLVHAAAPSRLPAATLRALDLSEQGHLLRVAPATWIGPLRAALGDEAFAAAFLEAWGIPAHYDTEAAMAAYALPGLDRLPLDTLAGREITLQRAEALVELGQRARAERLFRRLAEAPVPPGVEDDIFQTRSRAWEELARLAAQRGDDLAAAEAVERSLATAVVPSRASDRMQDDPLLEPYLPMQLRRIPVVGPDGIDMGPDEEAPRP